MRLMTEDVDIDMFDVNERTQRWESVRQAMKLGLITPDNFSWEDRNAVREFWAELPIVESTDARLGDARVVAIANLVEGREWCFATARDGTFGVFSLDEPSRGILEGATFHLWIKDSIIDPQDEGRVDFTDLADYQTEAQEAMQLAA